MADYFLYLKKEIKMKNLLIAIIATLTLTTSVKADITLVVPQKPGAGTSVWAQIIAVELQKFLPEETVTIKHIPGARGTPGFNQFHNELQYDDDTIMVSNGSNALSFLADNVDYDYRDYESIGLMNLNIITGRLVGTDMSDVKMHSYGGRQPEVMAMAMLICGPIVDPVTCFNDNINWIPGFSQGEGRLAFKRGELNVTRENPAAFKKHVQPVIDKGQASLWFHHGILDTATGEHMDDVNYPGILMEDLFYAANRVKPQSDLYAAYKLVKSFRDGMQKALWVAKGNPNKAKLIAALEKVATTPESIKAVQKKVGKYDWLIGKDGDAHRDTLMKLITPEALKTLVQFNNEAFGIKAVYKDTLVAQN